MADYSYLMKGIETVSTDSSVLVSSSPWLNDARLREWMANESLRRNGHDYPLLYGMATMVKMDSMSHVTVSAVNSAPNDVKYCANSACCASLMVVCGLLLLALFLMVNRVYPALRERFVSYVKTALWRPPQNTLFSPIF